MMKNVKLLLLVMMTFVSTQFFAQEVQNGAKISFEKEVHDYGTIEYGGNADCVFKFTNTGNAPLILSNVKRSCGCTTPYWPKEPIAPGETAEIKVRYDSKRPGAINKSITVTSNAVNAPTTVIRIKGSIKPKPTSGAPTREAGAPSVN